MGFQSDRTEFGVWFWTGMTEWIVELRAEYQMKRSKHQKQKRSGKWGNTGNTGKAESQNGKWASEFSS